MILRKNGAEESHFLTQTTLQSYSNEDSVVLEQIQKCRSKGKDRKLREKPTHLLTINLQKKS